MKTTVAVGPSTKSSLYPDAECAKPIGIQIRIQSIFRPRRDS